MPSTIPGLIAAAAERDPDGTWLRTDDGTLTFGGAAAQVSRLAARLQDDGVRRGDLVLVTARTTPPYLLCWLALASLGAVTVPTDPAGTPEELAALVGQVQPRFLVTDAALRATVDQARQSAGAEAVVLDIDDRLGDWRRVESADSWPGGSGLPEHTAVGPDDLAVLIPTSGTTGRSKLVMQTHRAYAMAGEGFPWWMELTAADRLMTSLPLFHINAPAYSVLGSLACGAGLVLLPRFSARGFLDSARRHGATEFNAIGAMLEILMRQPVRPDDADTDLRLCYTGPSPDARVAGGVRAAVRPAGGLRLCDVGVAVRADLAPRHPAVRHARLDPAAPDPGRRQRGPGRGRRPGRSWAWGRPASCCCATRR